MSFENNENDSYEHPKIYNYNITKYLKTDSEDINLYDYNKINICSFEINNEGIYPFLKFLLIPNLYSELSFPQIPINNLTLESLVESVKYFLYNLFLLDDYNFFDNNLKINGFYEYKNELYLFIDITKCKIVVDDIFSYSQAWMGILDEIINFKKICNINIGNEPYLFFNKNPDFCMLLDESGKPYEIPNVAFVGKGENKLNFTYIFGETSKNKNAILGPYYYLTNFNNAINEGYRYRNEVKNKCGIVRFAIFSGKTKYIENFPNDNIDESEIKKQRLNDTNLNILKEQLMMRISDHDGKWAEHYDSCYLGPIILDNGAYLEDTPLFVVKNLNQQVPLSYHYINKTTIQNLQTDNYIQTANYIL
jgi:hypothetical protein